MADDIPYDGAPPEVLVLPYAKGVKKSLIEEASRATEDIAADIAMEEIYPPEPEPEPDPDPDPDPDPELLPLGVRPFDPATYYPCTHVMAPRGILRFKDFSGGMHEDFFFREGASHLSYDAAERGYVAVTARDWYQELLARVRELVDEVGFCLFCSGLAQLQASRALLGALVERWWDTTNSFHFSSMGEMTMTPYDFSMIMGLRVRGDPIPFNIDMGQWKAAWTYLLGPCLSLDKLAMVCYSWWNTVGLYQLSALVVLLRVQFYYWDGAGLATLYGYMSSDFRKKENKVYAYFYPMSRDEVEAVVPYSRRYDGNCHPRRRSVTIFAYYHHLFDTVTTREVTWQPWMIMLTRTKNEYAESWAPPSYRSC
ncbi:hypothetical protein ACSBR2_017616 [Camellia fascicularis]